MRTEDDSWDITESVGVTAVGVAAMRAAEARRADALFRDPYAEKLVEAVGPEWSRVVRGEIGGGESGDGEDLAIAPLAAVLLARTVYFDDYVRAAVADGIRQFVILAAGLDARAYRMELPSDTVFFELDQPKVLEFKSGALGADRPAAVRREVAVDLRGDWPQALRDNGFDPDQPTAWLAEGLLRYLPADAQDRLFDNITAISAAGSRIALNIGLDHRRDSAQVREMRERRAAALAAVGTQVDVENLWYSWDGRTDPRTWFSDRGWLVSGAEPAAVLAERGRDVTPAIRDEANQHILMTATRGDDTP